MKRLLLLCLSVCASGAWAADPFVKGDPKAGEGKAAVCFACHGPQGNSTNPVWPSLAGQSSKYVVEQLKFFKAGIRPDPVMSVQAASLSEQDMNDLAAYFAAQAPKPGVASPQSVAVAQPLYRGGDAARGVPACGACHGPTGAGNPAAGYPRLSGQQAAYTGKSLRDLRGLAGKNLPEGNTKVMVAVAAKLTDAEIDALASYLAGLQ